MKVLPKKEAKERLKEQEKIDLERAKGLREAISNAERELNTIKKKIDSANAEFTKLAPDPKLLQERNDVELEVARLRREKEVLLTPVNELLKEAEEKKEFWTEELRKLDKRELELNKLKSKIDNDREDNEKNKKQIDNDLSDLSKQRKKIYGYEEEIKNQEAKLKKEKDDFEQYCQQKDSEYLEQADSLLLRERLVAEKLEANAQERSSLEEMRMKIESQQADLNAAIKEAKKKGIWEN